MAKIGGLDIPDALLDAWNSIFQFGSAATEDVIQSRITPASRYRTVSLEHRSLISLWAPLFDSFDLGRRNAWHSYWGGWPGSGFSAFIEVNAPRYASGQDLLLDPPATNLLYNGNFSAGALGWDVYLAIVSGGRANFSASEPLSFIHTANPYKVLAPGGITYRFSAYVGPGTGSVYIGIQSPENPFPEFCQDVPAGYGLVEFDFTPAATPDGLEALVVGGSGGAFDGWVDSFSPIAL